MNLQEYAGYDALGLARLVERREVSPRELAETALEAIEAVNPKLHAVIEIYADRTAGLDAKSLGPGPFRGVPFLIKDVGPHLKGRKTEFCSRLCQGMVGEADSNFATLLKASGVNILGRTNTPEFSRASSSENLLYGSTSTPWKLGYSVPRLSPPAPSPWPTARTSADRSEGPPPGVGASASSRPAGASPRARFPTSGATGWR